MNKRIKLAAIATTTAALAAGGIIYAMPDKKPTTQLSTQTPTAQTETAPVETQPAAAQTAEPAPAPVVDPTPTPQSSATDLRQIARQIVTDTLVIPAGVTDNTTVDDNFHCIDTIFTIRFNWGFTEAEMRNYLSLLQTRSHGYYCGILGDPNTAMVARRQVVGLF